MNKFHNTITIFLCCLSCLLPLLTLTTARPTIEPPRGYFPVSGLPQRQDGWNPHSRGQHTPAIFSRGRSSLFDERTPPGQSTNYLPLKLIAFTRVGLLVPVNAAARALEEFYSQIAIKASTIWPSEPRATDFIIKEGDFELAFNAVGDTIPWDFVAEMANRGWESACMGMTDLFEAIYTTENGRLAVRIALTLAEDSVASSDTVANDREGSVPSTYREGSIPPS